MPNLQGLGLSFECVTLPEITDVIPFIERIKGKRVANLRSLHIKFLPHLAPSMEYCMKFMRSLVDLLRDSTRNLNELYLGCDCTTDDDEEDVPFGPTSLDSNGIEAAWPKWGLPNLRTLYLKYGDDPVAFYAIDDESLGNVLELHIKAPHLNRYECKSIFPVSLNLPCSNISYLI